MTHRTQIANTLRQLAAEIEALDGRRADKPQPSPDKLVSDVATLLAGGHTVETALLPIKLKYGSTDAYAQAEARIKQAVVELRELGQQLEMA